MRFVVPILTFLLPFVVVSLVASQTHQQRLFQLPYGARVGPPHYFLEHRELRRPQVGLALSGGGARSLAQAGVLLALEENDIPIHFIAGTSMGSVIGGLYAAGYSATQIMEIIKRIPWDALIVDTPLRTTLFIAQKAERDRSYLQVRFNGFKPYIPPALTPGQQLINILTDLTMRANYRASANFDYLRIPYRAVATDLYSGKKIVIADGDLAEAMRASVAVPLLFAPVQRDSMLLLDGGLVDNIPVSVVRQHDVDLVIGVDTTAKLRRPNQLDAPWEIADQVTSIMQRDHNDAQRRAADVLIRLDGEPRASMDFSNLDSLFAAGHRAAMALMAEIKSKLSNTDHAVDDEAPLEIDQISVNGRPLPPAPGHDSNADNDHAARMRMSPKEIEAQLVDHYQTGSYASVRAVWRADSSRNTLDLQLTPNPVLRAVRFSGNTVFADSVLRNCIVSPLGESINHQLSRQDLETIIELYRGAGYALAEIHHARFDSTTGELHIDIDEGYIADIQIEGARHTRDVVIWREYPLQAGDIFDSNRSARGIQNIHSLGLFDQVAVNVTRRARSVAAVVRGTVEATAVVHIKLQEKPSLLSRLGLRYDTERSGRLWVEVGDENFLGLASKLFAHGMVGSRDYAGLLSWRIDRLLRTYLNFSAQLRYRYAKNYSYAARGERLGEYEDERHGLLLSLGQQVRRFGAVSAEINLENIQVRGLAGRGYDTGRETLNTLTFRSVVDTQDRVPFARQGRYAQLAYSMAIRQLQSEDSFFKFLVKLESSTTFAKRHTVHPRFFAGTSDQNTPFSEQFRIGGPEDMYGLHDQELVGRHFIIASLEYRYRLPTKLLFDTYLSPRFDFGTMWRDKDDVNYRKFRKAMGVALAWDTPLGPMALAIGTIENQANRVYFTAGYRF